MNATKKTASKKLKLPRWRRPSWKQIRHLIYALLLGILAYIILSLIYFQFRPLNLGYLNVPSGPVKDFAEADRRAKLLVAADEKNPDLNPDCHYRYLSQNKPVERVLVIRHGLTNCPRQFDKLADEYYKAGYAVLITRIPKHGLRDRTSLEPAKLSAEETMIDLNRSLDIAQGLGKKVDVMGLSVGGNEVALAAYQRGDIDQAIMINSLFSPKAVPTSLTRMATGGLLTIPNIFIWWDSKAKTELTGPTSVYYGFFTRPVGEYLRLTAALQDKPRDKPKARKLVMITNDNDGAVNNNVADGFISQWRKTGANVVDYRFPKSDGLNHDLIDPLQPDANTVISYPKILELTTQP